MASGERQSGEEVGSMLRKILSSQVKRGEGEIVRVGVGVRLQLRPGYSTRSCLEAVRRGSPRRCSMISLSRPLPRPIFHFMRAGRRSHPDIHNRHARCCRFLSSASSPPPTSPTIRCASSPRTRAVRLVSDTFVSTSHAMLRDPLKTERLNLSELHDHMSEMSATSRGGGPDLARSG
jgi:hypothetical protein